MESNNKSYYAVIPANVRYDESLPPNAKLLYGEITALCSSEGHCWASNKYFAELYGVSTISISKWINTLIRRGYIASRFIYKEGAKEIDKRYITIVYDPIKEKFNTPIKEKLKDNNTSLNNTTNKKKKESKNSFDEIINGYLSPDGVSIRFKDHTERRELLQEWLKVRKAKRAAMTDRAIQMNIEKLDELANKSGMTVTEYLGEVIRRGWATFFEIKKYDNKTAEPKGEEPDNIFLKMLNEGAFDE